ncbi:unnamed protein product [Paramecium octaurelia]|uniref:Uncharacterized protein n=1 Tax=Paramecium octaurelia TaxID=43137 RepID=A0A8S1VCD8_PAROT|nr:unnamed protein product [Paramecium octaurelia]
MHQGSFFLNQKYAELDMFRRDVRERFTQKFDNKKTVLQKVKEQQMNPHQSNFRNRQSPNAQQNIQLQSPIRIKQYSKCSPGRLSFQRFTNDVGNVNSSLNIPKKTLNEIAAVERIQDLARALKGQSYAATDLYMQELRKLSKMILMNELNLALIIMMINKNYQNSPLESISTSFIDYSLQSLKSSYSYFYLSNKCSSLNYNYNIFYKYIVNYFDFNEEQLSLFRIIMNLKKTLQKDNLSQPQVVQLSLSFIINRGYLMRTMRSDQNEYSGRSQKMGSKILRVQAQNKNYENKISAFNDKILDFL